MTNQDEGLPQKKRSTFSPQQAFGGFVRAAGGLASGLLRASRRGCIHHPIAHKTTGQTTTATAKGNKTVQHRSSRGAGTLLTQ